MIDSHSDKPFKYDVAFSFLNQDLEIAKALHDGLSPQLEVFMYAQRQEELAGTDGLETFRKPFHDECRLVVVLFRAGWGDTPWTRVEKQAIQDRFLQEGPDFLFFIMMDCQSSPPPWLPTNKIRFNLEDFGLEQATGAIKARVQELGGTFHAETVAERAKRIHQQVTFDEETKRLFRCEEGVRQVASAVSDIIQAFELSAREAQEAAPNLSFEFGSEPQVIGIRTQRVSILIGWNCRFSNVLEGAYVAIKFFRGPIILPGERNRMYIGGRGPKCTVEHQFVPARIFGQGWCWRDEMGKSTISSTRVAQVAIELLLEEFGKPQKERDSFDDSDDEEDGWTQVF